MILDRIGAMEFGFETAFGAGSAGYNRIILKEPPSVDGLTRRMIEDESMRVGHYRRSGIPGEKSGSTFTMGFDLQGNSSTVPAVPAAAHRQSELIGQAMGNYHFMGAAFHDTTAGASKTVLDMVAGAAADYVAGQPCLILTADGYEPCVIKTVVNGGGGPATDDITLRSTLYQLPGAAAKLYSGITCFCTDVWQKDSIAAKLLGQDAVNAWTMLGMRPTSFKITGTPKEFAYAEIAYSVYDWTRPGAGGAPAYAADANPPREHLVGSFMRIEQGGTIVDMDFTSFEFEYGLLTTQPTDGTMAQGTNDLVKVDHAARLTIDPAYVDENVFAAFDANTSFDLILKFGEQPGRSMLITMPRAELVEFPGIHNGEEIKRVKHVFEAKIYEGDTGAASTTLPTDADCAVAFI